MGTLYDTDAKKSFKIQIVLELFKLWRNEQKSPEHVGLKVKRQATVEVSLLKLIDVSTQLLINDVKYQLMTQVSIDDSSVDWWL